MTNITRYFADQLVDVAEIQEIIKTLNVEFNNLHNKIYKILQNMFLLDMDEDGCIHYEKMLGIKIREDDTLEDRKFRILTLYKGDTPYTIISLRRKLEDLCGAENVEITLDADAYNIQIYIGLASKNQYDTAFSVINKMLPCNLVLNYSLKFNQHSTLAQYTHGQLADFTHDQLRNYVIDIGG